MLGFLRAYSISSMVFLAGTRSGTASSSGPDGKTVTGVMSLARSKGSLL